VAGVFPSAGHHAFGLLVAVPPSGLQLFHNKVEAFDVEMDNSSMELITTSSCAAARRSNRPWPTATSRRANGVSQRHSHGRHLLVLLIIFMVVTPMLQKAFPWIWPCQITRMT